MRNSLGRLLATGPECEDVSLVHVVHTKRCVASERAKRSKAKRGVLRSEVEIVDEFHCVSFHPINICVGLRSSKLALSPDLYKL